MTQNSDNGIEFEIGDPDGTGFRTATTVKADDPHPDLKDIVRNSFRVPCEANTVTVRINDGDASYAVVDIENRGISFLVDREDRFSVGDELYRIELIYGEKSIQLNGSVVHVSEYRSGSYLCGVKLNGLNERDKEEFYRFVMENRRKVLAKS